MEFVIKYNSDEQKKERVKRFIKANQGITANKLYTAMNMTSRTYQKLIKEMARDGELIIKNGQHNAICHYIRA